MKRKEKPIVSLADVNEANILEQVLKQEQIPYRVEHFQGAGGGIYQLVDPTAAANYCRIWAFNEDEERILQLLQEVREAQVLEAEPDVEYASEFVSADLDAAELAALNAEAEEEL